MKPHKCPVCNGTKTRVELIEDINESNIHFLNTIGYVFPLKPIFHPCVACDLSGIVWEPEKADE